MEGVEPSYIIGTDVVPTSNQVMEHWRLTFNQRIIGPKLLIYPIYAHGLRGTILLGDAPRTRTGTPHYRITGSLANFCLTN